MNSNNQDGISTVPSSVVKLVRGFLTAHCSLQFVCKQCNAIIFNCILFPIVLLFYRHRYFNIDTTIVVSISSLILSYLLMYYVSLTQNFRHVAMAVYRNYVPSLQRFRFSCVSELVNIGIKVSTDTIVGRCCCRMFPCTLAQRYRKPLSYSSSSCHEVESEALMGMLSLSLVRWTGSAAPSLFFVERTCSAAMMVFVCTLSLFSFADHNV